MADQYDPQSDSSIRIKAIYIHPVKSCGPIELDRALLTKAGFMYDRCFAIATESARVDAGLEWRFISQRTKPQMSQIKTELWLPQKDSNPHDPFVQAGGCLVLTFPDPEPPTWINRLDALLHTWTPSTPPQVSFTVPLQPTPAQLHPFNIRQKAFAIHSRTAHGLDLSPIPSVAAALPQLKQFLGLPQRQPLTLLRCTPATLVRTKTDLAPLAHIGSPSLHGYTDQQPLNINSLSSVHAVSALLPAENRPLNALRFRANIWIAGAPAYDEETWKRFRVRPRRSSGGGVEEQQQRVAATICVVCRTSRCTMPNVDPERGVFDADAPLPGRKRGRPQPSATLVEYRMVETGVGSALGFLGMHCVPEDRSLEEAGEAAGEQG
ncbi:hypothetical protein DBV05_g11671, partial [Lasiodiplodia theobromae]